MSESVVEMVNETTVTEELIESSVDISTLKQEDDSQFLSTTIGYGEAHPISYEEVMMNEKKTLRKSKISSKNAERQKLKRMLETPEEKEIRRQKNAEQTKLRRERLRQENPEKYAEILRNVAERKRIKRMTMSEQEKQELRMKEATSARYRRNLLSPEKKEIYKQRNRDSARARRTKKPNFDVKEEIDDTCSSQEIYYIEQVWKVKTHQRNEINATLFIILIQFLTRNSGHKRKVIVEISIRFLWELKNEKWLIVFMK